MEASPLGMVKVVLAAPASADLPVSVSVMGLVETVSSPPIRAGQNGGPTLFSMAARHEGMLNIQVTVGTTVADATVRIVDDQRLVSVALTPASMVRGGSVQARVREEFGAQAQRTIGIVSLRSGETLGQAQTSPTLTGPDNIILFSIGMTVEVGMHRLIAVSAGRPGIDGVSVAGPVDLLVT